MGWLLRILAPMILFYLIFKVARKFLALQSGMRDAQTGVRRDRPKPFVAGRSASQTRGVIDLCPSCGEVMSGPQHRCARA